MAYVVRWRVSGMTCASCERNIVRTLSDHPAIASVEASTRKSLVILELKEARHPGLRDECNVLLVSFGYVLAEEGCALPVASRVSFGKRMWRAGLALAAILGLVTIFGPSIQKVMPSVTATATVGALFVLGLVASVSSCLASTGGFLLAYAAEVGSERRTLAVHVGRLLTFILGGALLGLIGGALPAWSGAWSALFAFVLGVGFLGVSLHLFDLMPSWSALGISLPASVYGIGYRVRGSKGPLTPYLVGAVTFVLPCGFTQTAQALALASGSASHGALIMLAFALGTLPVLAGLTLFAAKADLSHPALRLAAGAMIFLFAMGQFQAGAAILGLATPAMFQPKTGTATVSGSEQAISMEVTSYSYEPSVFTLKKGVPVRWQVYASDVSGCTNTLVSRDLGISQRLDKGMNELTFTPQKTGKIAFSCGMGMVRGSFTVVN